jgi:hypothetical protein
MQPIDLRDEFHTAKSFRCAVLDKDRLQSLAGATTASGRYLLTAEIRGDSHPLTNCLGGGDVPLFHREGFISDQEQAPGRPVSSPHQLANITWRGE